jgi:hypothetical protein
MFLILLLPFTRDATKIMGQKPNTFSKTVKRIWNKESILVSPLKKNSREAG